MWASLGAFTPNANRIIRGMRLHTSRLASRREFRVPRLSWNIWPQGKYSCDAMARKPVSVELHPTSLTSASDRETDGYFFSLIRWVMHRIHVCCERSIRVLCCASAAFTPNAKWILTSHYSWSSGDGTFGRFIRIPTLMRSKIPTKESEAIFSSGQILVFSLHRLCMYK